MTPLRSPAFRRLWVSTVAASASMGMERTATAWLALQLGATPLELGLVFAARMLPSLLLGLVAGTVADRADRRLQLVAVGGGSALLMAAFAGLVASGRAPVWGVVAFALLAGCVSVFDTPARQALVLDTSPPEAAQRAMALNALAARFASAVGALSVGALIPLAGAAGAYVAMAAASAAMALLAASLPEQHGHRFGGEPAPFWRSMREAAQLMVEAPVVRTLVVAGLVCEVFAFSHGTALPLFAQDVLRAGPDGLGTLNAAASVGGAVAVALLAAVPERVPRQRLLGATFAAYGLCLVALAGTQSLWLAAAILLVTGCCASAFDVLQQTLLQLAVPREQRGRAMGLWVFSIGSAPAGHLEMGALAGALGVPAALALNGALTLASAAVLLVTSPAYRPRAAREA